MPNFRRFVLPGQCYFVTTTTAHRRPYFREQKLARIVLDNIGIYRERMGFLLYAYVIMPDHLHLLLALPRGSISDVMRNLKSYTSKEIREALGEPGPVWQARFYDRVIRDEREFVAVMQYVHLNPVRAGLVECPEAYEFSSARGGRISPRGHSVLLRSVTYGERGPTVTAGAVTYGRWSII